MSNLGIYVHIPFCKRKCKYCDFISFAEMNEQMPKYKEALIKEINKSEYGLNRKIDTIYFGGGTPSVIPVEFLEEIFNTIKEKYDIEDNAEITIEINPGTVDKEKLKKIKEIGFNRLSIGLQSTQNRLLKTIGRIHTYEQFLETYNNAKEVGFTNINVDLMIGLPSQRLEDVEDSLAEVIKINPNHISVYSLIVEEGTAIQKEIENNELTLPDEKIERKMYHKVKNLLEKNGYKHYEISNFSKPGFESRHNLNCWNQKEYIGFGLAAHSYFERKRFSNTIDLNKYINEFDNKEIHEVQTDEAEKKEYMMLGLRKIDGVKISDFEQKFKLNPLFYFRFEISELTEKNLLEVDLDNIKLTNKGLDLANIVFEEFV